VRSFVAVGLWCGLRPVGAAAAAFAYAQFFWSLGRASPFGVAAAAGLWCLDGHPDKLTFVGMLGEHKVRPYGVWFPLYTHPDVGVS